MRKKVKENDYAIYAIIGIYLLISIAWTIEAFFQEEIPLVPIINVPISMLIGSITIFRLIWLLRKK